MARATLGFVIAMTWVSVAHAQTACVEEPTLAHAAAELAARTEPWDGTTLIREARAAGSDLPVVDAFTSDESDAAARTRFVEDLARRHASPIACGEARTEGRSVLVAGPRAGGLELVGDHALRVRLAGGWRAARLVARDRHGTAWTLPADGDETIELPVELEAPFDVQLVADGPLGPRPIAERSFGADDSDVALPSPDAPLAEAIADLRAAQGVAPLRRNHRIALVAAAHAGHACRSGQIAHTEAGLDPEARLARAGVRARHVGETIARASDRERAFAAMARSPSHRAALADPRFTDVGVGVARDESDHVCVVVLLAAWPRAVPWR